MQRTILVAALLAASGSVSGAKPTHDGISAPPQQAASQYPRGTKDSPLTVTGVVGIERTEREVKRQDDESKEKGSVDARVARYTGLGALFTLLLVCATVAQILLFYSQLKIMRRGLRDSAKSAQAAMLASKAAKESADTLRKVERAHVFVQVELDHPNTSLGTSANGRSRVRAKVTFRNEGRTPAQLERIRATAVIADAVPMVLIQTENSAQTLPVGLVLAAGGELVDGAFTQLSDEDIAQMRNGDRTVYFMAVVDYMDVTGTRCSTGFCWNLQDMGHGDFRPVLTRGTPLNFRT